MPLLPNPPGRFYTTLQHAASGGGPGSPKTTTGNTFQPLWTVFLSIVVHIVGSVLLYYQVTGLEQLVPVTPRFGPHFANNITQGTGG